MSTTTDRPLSTRVAWLAKDLLPLVTQLEGDLSLLDAGQLRRRIEILDALDTGFGNVDSAMFRDDATLASIHHRVEHMRSTLEAINAELYQSIRFEMKRGAQPHTLLQWIQSSASRDEPRRSARGLAFDYRDEVVSGILQISKPRGGNLQHGHETVFYQPTPARHILELVTSLPFSEADLLVDLGSGLGHVPLLTSLLTGVRSLGIEVQAPYVASAQECAQSLCPGRCQFIHQDARAADLSTGTVFYRYSPFTGSILADVLDRLRKESTRRPIRICSLGPCTSVIARESWLKASEAPDAEQIIFFQTHF